MGDDTNSEEAVWDDFKQVTLLSSGRACCALWQSLLCPEDDLEPPALLAALHPGSRLGLKNALPQPGCVLASAFFCEELRCISLSCICMGPAAGSCISISISFSTLLQTGTEAIPSVRLSRTTFRRVLIIDKRSCFS